MFLNIFNSISAHDGSVPAQWFAARKPGIHWLWANIFNDVSNQLATHLFGVWISLRQLAIGIRSALPCLQRFRSHQECNHTTETGDLSSVFWICQSLCTGPMPAQSLPHAYAEWQGCLGWSFPRLGAFEGASAGVLCWIVMHLINDGKSA